MENKASDISSSETVPADRFTFLRALGHLEPDETVRCPDYLAQIYLDEEWRDALSYRVAILKRFDASAPGAYAYGLARTHYIDNSLRSATDAGIRQVLILGSGFDSRADRFSLDEPISFFEFDRAVVHRIKKHRRDAAGLPKNINDVAAIPINFDKGDVSTLLDSIDINYSLPVVILAEGLLYYLNEDFFMSLLRFISTRAAKGSQLVFDYAHSNLLLHENDYYGGNTIAQFANKGVEAFKFLISPEQMTKTCARFGLSMVSKIDHEQMSTQFLKKIDGTQVAQPFGGFHFCTLVVTE